MEIYVWFRTFRCLRSTDSARVRMDAWGTLGVQSSVASLLTLSRGRSNYRNAVDAKRMPAWRRIAQRIELGEIIGGAA